MDVNLQLEVFSEFCESFDYGVAIFQYFPCGNVGQKSQFRCVLCNNLVKQITNVGIETWSTLSTFLSGRADAIHDFLETVVLRQTELRMEDCNISRQGEEEFTFFIRAFAVGTSHVGVHFYNKSHPWVIVEGREEETEAETPKEEGAAPDHTVYNTVPNLETNALKAQVVAPLLQAQYNPNPNQLRLPSINSPAFPIDGIGIDSILPMGSSGAESWRDVLKVNNRNDDGCSSCWDKLSVGICSFDEHGAFTKVNSAFCFILGHTSKDLLSMTLNDITHESDVALSSSLLQQLNRSEISEFALVTRYNPKLGNHITCAVKTRAYFEPGGKIAHFSWVIDLGAFQADFPSVKLKFPQGFVE